MKRLSAAVVGLCILLVACYEEPVRDHLHIAFAEGSAIVVTAVRDIASQASAGENPAVEDRLEEARDDLASGWDRWSRSFAELGAIADRTTIERRDGRASRGIHSALVETFRPVERLLRNEGLVAYFEDVGSERELQLSPAGAGQATRQQRAKVDGALVTWSGEISAYLEAATALYAYLDRVPHRAAPCFAHVFDIHAEESGPLEEHEGELVKRVKETTERVADVLLIDTGDAYSLNELSRLAFDTFQGRLTFAIDGPVIEIEGFDELEGFLERPPVDLWRALETMVGQWLAPDMVTALVRPGPDEFQPEPEPRAFARLQRRWRPPPDPATVEKELRDRLQPEPIYRVRWQVPRQSGDEDEDRLFIQAFEMLRTAEEHLPE